MDIELHALIAAGRVIPASRRGPVPEPEGDADVTVDSTDIVSELREERL